MAIITRDGFIFDTDAVEENLNRIVGQIFRLLPTREEEKDWIKPLETLTIELSGMASIFSNHQTKLLSLVCKLEGLKEGGEDIDFLLFRRSIFEACSLAKEIADSLKDIES